MEGGKGRWRGGGKGERRRASKVQSRAHAPLLCMNKRDATVGVGLGLRCAGEGGRGRFRGSRRPRPPHLPRQGHVTLNPQPTPGTPTLNPKSPCDHVAFLAVVVALSRWPSGKLPGALLLLQQPSAQTHLRRRWRHRTDLCVTHSVGIVAAQNSLKVLGAPCAPAACPDTDIDNPAYAQRVLMGRVGAGDGGDPRAQDVQGAASADGQLGGAAAVGRSSRLRRLGRLRRPARAASTGDLSRAPRQA